VAALGIEHLVFITPGPWTEESIGRLADAVNAVKALEPS
jgi:hypothetical protein